VPDRPVAEALDVDAGATCFEQARVAASVQAWLQRDQVAGDVEVHLVGDGNDPTVAVFRIVRSGATRERRFASLPLGCEDATAVVGLAIALAIDAEVLKTVVAPEEPSPPPRRALAVQVAGGYEVVPGGSIGGSVGMELGVASWLSVRLDFLGLYSWGNAIDGVAGVFDVVAGAAVPQLCAGGDLTDRVRFEMCSGVPVGVLHAQGRDYAVSHGASGVWVEASAGVRLLFQAGIPWAIDLGGLFPVRSPSFRAENATGAAQFRAPNPAGVLLAVGPAFKF
jgi:hypothetical protein